MAAGLLLIASATSAALRAAEEVPLDSEASAVRFRIAVWYLFRVEGRFRQFDVHLELRPEEQSARVWATIEVASVEMADPNDARTVLGEDFFDAARHPTIGFQSEPFSLALLEQGGRIGGRLRIRGIEQAVGLELEPEPACRGRGAGTCRLRARARVMRSAFGMLARRGILSDAVDLELLLVPRPAVPADASIAHPLPGIGCRRSARRSIVTVRRSGSTRIALRRGGPTRGSFLDPVWVVVSGPADPFAARRRGGYVGRGRRSTIDGCEATADRSAPRGSDGARRIRRSPIHPHARTRA